MSNPYGSHGLTICMYHMDNPYGSYRLSIRMSNSSKKISFSRKVKQNAKITIIVDNQQPKHNDSNKTMHKQTQNDKENNLP